MVVVHVICECAKIKKINKIPAHPAALRRELPLFSLSIPQLNFPTFHVHDSIPPHDTDSPDLINHPTPILSQSLFDAYAYPKHFACSMHQVLSYSGNQQIKTIA